MTPVALPPHMAGREPLLAFVTDDATLDALQSALAELGWRLDGCKKGSLRAAVQSLSVMQSPAMLLVDVSDTPDPAAAIDELAEVCEPGTIVFAVGTLNDVDLYRSLLARGIHDYLVKPLFADQLRDALVAACATLETAREKTAPIERAHISTAVIGTRGGVGASMLATSLAWLLASEHGLSTALLDLDIHFGTGALTLDLEPGRGLTDAIENPGRIDGLFIERAMVRVGDNLSIMSSEAPLGAALMTDGSAFLRLEQEFAQAFAACVIDLPRSMMINFPQLLANVANIVVTAEMTLASARDAIRIVSWLKLHAPDARIVLVANKVQTGATEISTADFCAAVERAIDITLPFDHKAAVNAARLGQSFAQASPSSKSAAPLFELARTLVDPKGSPAEMISASLASNQLFAGLDLKGLLGRKSRPAGRTGSRAA